MRYRLIILLVITSIILPGCMANNSRTVSEGSDSAAIQPSSIQVISDAEASSENSSSEIIPYEKSSSEEILTQTYYKKYLSPAMLSGITAINWSDTEEIPAGKLTLFYMLHSLYKEYPDGWPNMLEIPANEVEKIPSSILMFQQSI